MTTEDDVVIEWGVRASLLQYLLREPDAQVLLDGGAELDAASPAGPLVRLPARRSASGAIVATASACLRAHGGALAVDLVDVVIADGALWVADPVEDATASPRPRIRLVTLAEEAEAGEGVRSWETRLAPEADALFLYRYLAGSAFAPVRVVPAAGSVLSERS